MHKRQPSPKTISLQRRSESSPSRRLQSGAAPQARALQVNAGWTASAHHHHHRTTSASEDVFIRPSPRGGHAANSVTHRTLPETEKAYSQLDAARDPNHLRRLLELLTQQQQPPTSHHPQQHEPERTHHHDLMSKSSIHASPNSGSNSQGRMTSTTTAVKRARCFSYDEIETEHHSSSNHSINDDVFEQLSLQHDESFSCQQDLATERQAPLYTPGDEEADGGKEELSSQQRFPQADAQGQSFKLNSHSTRL